MDWNAILKFIIGAAAGSGLLYWLFKTLGTRFIDHLFKAREAEQDQHHRERLQEIDQKHREHLREIDHRYNLLQQEHGTTFTELHRRRAEVLKKLNDDLWDYKLFLLHLRSAAWGNNPAEWRKSILDQVQPKTNALYEYYDKNRIYLTDEVCKAIERTINLYRELNNTFLVFAAYEGQRMPTKEEFETIALRLSYECREDFRALQDEFGTLLGVKVVKTVEQD